MRPAAVVLDSESHPVAASSNCPPACGVLAAVCGEPLPHGPAGLAVTFDHEGTAAHAATDADANADRYLHHPAIRDRRLNPRVGYIAGWTGTGLGLTKTSDGGLTWHRLQIPASHLTALRFIDEGVGWAAGFANRSAPQIACQQAAPVDSQQCKGLVRRTQDGGQSWQTVLAIPTDGIIGEPIRQIQ